MDDDYAEKVARGLVSVADEAGEIVGLIVLLRQPGHLLVENVAVAPERQGEGVGRDLLAFAEETLTTKILLFVAVTVPTLLLTFYTVQRSRRLSEFLDALSDEDAPLRAKWQAFLRVWKAPRLGRVMERD